MSIVACATISRPVRVAVASQYNHQFTGHTRLSRIPKHIPSGMVPRSELLRPNACTTVRSCTFDKPESAAFSHFKTYFASFIPLYSRWLERSLQLIGLKA
jgi:hypothetical protein